MKINKSDLIRLIKEETAAVVRETASGPGRPGPDRRPDCPPCPPCEDEIHDEDEDWEPEMPTLPSPARPEFPPELRGPGGPVPMPQHGGGPAGAVPMPKYPSWPRRRPVSEIKAFKTMFDRVIDRSVDQAMPLLKENLDPTTMLKMACSKLGRKMLEEMAFQVIDNPKTAFDVLQDALVSAGLPNPQGEAEKVLSMQVPGLGMSLEDALERAEGMGGRLIKPALKQMVPQVLEGACKATEQELPVKIHEREGRKPRKVRANRKSRRSRRSKK